MKRTTLVAALVLGAGAALAHSDVKNADVLARMTAMSGMAEQVKMIGQMAKGEAAFDAAKARKAASEIARLAADTPGLFEVPADDPKSEALPAIWEDFAGFSDKAAALEGTAQTVAGAVAEQADLQQALAGLGRACKACHAEYRE